MSRLILLSDGLSTKTGKGLIARIFPRKSLISKSILLISPPKYNLELALVNACKDLGFDDKNIHVFCEAISLFDRFDFIYVTEGNAFEILDYLIKNQLLDFIRMSFKQMNTSYIGASAGAMIAGINIDLAQDFDDNNLSLVNFRSLGLFNGTIIPHYSRNQLRRYLGSKESSDIAPYKVIYSVANSKVFILDINHDKSYD